MRAVALLALLAPARAARCIAAASPAWTASAARHPALLASAEAVSTAPAPSEMMGDAKPDLTLVSPAKVNMFLRIVKRRDDGYHELASLFQTVSLFDTLDFWATPLDADKGTTCSMEVDERSVNAELIPTDETNLVMRALALFAERTDAEQRVHCRLLKRIPAQAGLGGGSSDAATALHAANRLAGFPASQEELIRWGGELGSDVSFFLSRGTAYCTGRGELVEFRDPLPAAVTYLIKPDVGLSTPKVFGALGLSAGQELDGPHPQGLLDKFEASVYDLDGYVNDLEPPAFELLPMLRDLRDELRKLGFKAVMMSGSGTTFFCIGEPALATPGWQAELQEMFPVEVYAEKFCQRPEDEALWYNE